MFPSCIKEITQTPVQSTVIGDDDAVSHHIIKLEITALFQGRIHKELKVDTLGSIKASPRGLSNGGKSQAVATEEVPENPVVYRRPGEGNCLAITIFDDGRVGQLLLLAVEKDIKVIWEVCPLVAYEKYNIIIHYLLCFVCDCFRVKE